MKKLFLTLLSAGILFASCSKSTTDDTTSSTSTTATTVTTSTTSTTSVGNPVPNILTITGDSDDAGKIIYPGTTIQLLNYATSGSEGYISPVDGTMTLIINDGNATVKTAKKDVSIIFSLKGVSLGTYGLATAGNSMNLYIKDLDGSNEKNYASANTSGGNIVVTKFGAVGSTIEGTYGTTKSCALAYNNGTKDIGLNVTAGKFKVTRTKDR